MILIHRFTKSHYQIKGHICNLNIIVSWVGKNNFRYRFIQFDCAEVTIISLWAKSASLVIA